MAMNGKKLLYYGAIGVLVAIMLITSVFATPIVLRYIFPKKQPDTGTLVLKVTDAPVPDLQHLNLTISRNPPQKWILDKNTR